MNTHAIMRTVAAALMPAICAAVYERGAGALAQVLVAVCGCIAAEAFCLRLRGKPLNILADGSAAVAGIIIGLSLPPLAPWYVAAAAAGFAMALAKHCYGGLGNNPFNPAMAGYALAFVSFPADFGGWNAESPWTAVFFSAAAIDAQ
ncbi:MAG: RnfABCDGE type electron transport complex subunit D, partial [Betaproteobacteria bacterium]|nr:RnfABCDGE type electron transport complex subunit D [Betaproteobacteria bacterium]